MRGPILGLALGFFLTGCATTKRVRWEVRGQPVLSPVSREGRELAAVGERDFRRSVAMTVSGVHPPAAPFEFARRLFDVPVRSAAYVYDVRERQLLSADQGITRGSSLWDLQPDDATLGYERMCRRRGQSGDCLHLLGEGPLLGSDGKYAVAMAIALGSVWVETAEALRGMAEPEALMAMITSTVTVYLLLWTLPEPASKGLAAMLTASAIAYLGVDTVWTLLDGWLQLVRTVDAATTFDALRAAGERYGAVLGRNAARVFVMLATAAIARTFAAGGEVAPLPGGSQAALALESQAGVRFAAIADVESVAMTAEGFTIALASGTVAASSAVQWTNYGGKHFPSKTLPWKEIVRGTQTGPAKYKPGVDVEALERRVHAEGKAVTNGKPWKVMEFEEVIGAKAGSESRWVRVEESAGTLHGHPITAGEFAELTR